MFGFVLLFIACYCAFFNVFVFVFVFVHSAQCDGRRMDRSDGRSVRRAPSPSLTLDTHRLPSAFTDHHHHHQRRRRRRRRRHHPHRHHEVYDYAIVIINHLQLDLSISILHSEKALRCKSL